MSPTDEALVRRYAGTDPAWRIADLGSYACHGGRCVASILPCRHVTGFDLVSGPGVDIVLPAEGYVPTEHHGRYDVVFCLSTLQFAADPGACVWEACQLARPGTGIAVLTTCGPKCVEQHNTSKRWRENEWRPTMRELVQAVGQYLTVEAFEDSEHAGHQWVQAVRR